MIIDSILNTFLFRKAGILLILSVAAFLALSIAYSKFFEDGQLRMVIGWCGRGALVLSGLALAAFWSKIWLIAIRPK